MRGWPAVLLTIVSGAIMAFAGLVLMCHAAPIYDLVGARAEAPTESMPPGIPMSIRGTVKVDGHNVITGTTISARSKGVIYAQTFTLMDQGSSVYVIVVPADALETPERDGGTIGETLEFTVAGLLAEQTAVWDNTESHQINLTASALRFYMPLIVR